MSPDWLAARRVYRFAALYGAVSLLPMYFLESVAGRYFPPAIAHPEQYYGFLGIALAWQAAFLVIARDPVRYRSFMLPAILEKLAYGGAIVALFILGRVGGAVLATGLIDLLFALAFVVAYRNTPR